MIFPKISFNWNKLAHTIQQVEMLHEHLKYYIIFFKYVLDVLVQPDFIHGKKVQLTSNHMNLFICSIVACYLLNNHSNTFCIVSIIFRGTLLI